LSDRVRKTFDQYIHCKIKITIFIMFSLKNQSFFQNSKLAFREVDFSRSFSLTARVASQRRRP
jgi:hypothetical protein